MSFRIRRGVDADRQTRTFDLGEPVYITDTGKLYIGDGSTPGGVLLGNELSNDSSPELSGSLDLNGNNIVGTGNINIDGTITASGNINLGDGAEDNVIVGGQISSDLIPADDSIYDLGAVTRTWKAGYFEGLNVDGELTTNSIAVDTIINRDSTVIWESSINELQADLRGDVYAQDSGVIIDSERGDIFATDIRANIVFSNLQGTVFANNGDIIVNSVSKDISSGTILAQDSISCTSNDENQTSKLNISLFSDNEDLSSDPFLDYGSLFFQRNDINGVETTAFIRGGPDYLTIGAGTNFGDANTSDNRVILIGGNFGIGTLPPTEKLDVAGNIKARGSGEFFGEVTAATFKGSLSADDSTIIVDGIENSITTNTVLTDILNLAVLNTEPTIVENGTVAIADGSGWDPMLTGVQTMVVYLDGAWQQLASA